MGAWTHDLGFAFRTLRRRPGFTFAVLVTLALGVGANTALFSVFRAVFLQPISLPASEELVFVMELGGFGCCGPASGPDYLDWRERNRSLEELGALSPRDFTLTGLTEPQRVYGTLATSTAFEAVGVPPLLGRTLQPEDQDGASVVVLSHELWQGPLGGRPDVLGTDLEVDGASYAVVGVMPEDFDLPSPWSQMGDQKLYLPFPNEQLAGNRGNHGFPVVARLPEGVTIEAAQADMDRVMRELAAEYPSTNGDRGVRLISVHQRLLGTAGRQLGVLLGAALVVLMIACGNVAGLFLTRAAGRDGELAVRAALGARRGELVRLLFLESLVLALLGGIGGLAVSAAAVEALRTLLPPTIPRVSDIRMDLWALGFAVGASAFTALLVGMVPALLAARGGLAASVKEGGYSTVAPAKERLREVFIVGQVALGLVLANSAALLVRSYATLRGEDSGFRPEGVVTLSLDPAGPRYQQPEEYSLFFDDVIERVSALPAVTAVGTVSRLPLFGGSNGNVWVEGRPPRANEGEGPLVEVTSVNGDYFEAIGIPLRKGRLLLPEDSASGAVGVVINQRFADVGWPGEDPLGKRFSFSDDPPVWVTVVGVVGDVRQWGPEQPALAQVYFPYTRGWNSASYLVVRADGDLSSPVGAIRSAVRSVDPQQAPSDIRTMSDRVDGTLAGRRFYTTFVTLFAVAALLLASAGVYATLTHFVRRRTREMGIRMALGAGGTGIVGRVVGRGVGLAAVGLAVGLVGVWSAASVLGSLVYGVRAVDAVTLVGGCATLLIVAATASALPAFWALRISPAVALKAE